MILRFNSASPDMLMKLVRLQSPSPDHAVAVGYMDFARLFGVSRMHVRALFKTVAADGDMEVDGRDGPAVL